MSARSPLSLRRALDQWQLGVEDPDVEDRTTVADHDRKLITSYIRDGLGWGPSTNYRGDGTFAWCGAFAAWCAPELPVLVRRAHASTWRLLEHGRKNPLVQVALGAILPGDVVTVGQGDYGSHIVRAVAWGDERRSELVTVSGNGEGAFPDGSWGEGVVLRVYPRNALRCAYRF